MIRSCALRAVAGYRDNMIAGEDPELCVRLRMAGWRTWRLDAEMTSHDGAMTRFGQWWTRILRSGYAFAHGAYLHGKSGERHWVWQSRRAWIWGVGLPVICLSAGLLFGPWGWKTWLIFPIQVLRQSYRNSGTLRDRLVLSLFQLLARFPEAVGEIKFMRDRILGVARASLNISDWLVRIAYLINQCPALSPSFTRREILAHDGLHEWLYCQGRYEPYG